MKKVQTKKLPKGISQEFVDSIQALTTENLKALIVGLQLSNQENEEFKASEAFEKVQAEYDTAKDRYNLVAGPIRDLTVSIKNKTKLVIERLKEKGGC